MNDLHRFAQQLVTSLGAHAPAALASPVAIREIVERVLPYRAGRRLLGILSVEDYEILLLRLAAGEGGLADAMPSEAAERARAELDTGHPDPGRLRELEDATLRLNLGAIAIGALVAEAEDPEPVRRRYELVEPDTAEAAVPAPPGIEPATEPATPPPEEAVSLDAAAELTAPPPAPAAEPEEPGGPAPELAPVAGHLPEQAAPAMAPAAELDEGAGPAPGLPVEAGSEPEPAPAAEDAPPPAPEAPAPVPPPGAPAVSPPEVAGGPPAALHPEPPPRCPHCASRLPVGRPVRFCPHCGGNVVPLQCPRCAADLEPTWRHCVLCGTPVVHDSRFA